MEFSVTIWQELGGIEFYIQLNWNVNQLPHSHKNGDSLLMTMTDVFLYAGSFYWKEFLKTEILN